MAADSRYTQWGALPRPAQEPPRSDSTNLEDPGDAAVEGIKIEVSLKVEVHEFKKYTVGMSPLPEYIICMDIMIG